MTSIVAPQLYSKFCMLKQARYVVLSLLICSSTSTIRESSSALSHFGSDGITCKAWTPGQVH